jgi:hypothetical protein
LYPVQRLIKIYYENKTSFKGNIIEPLNQIKDKGIISLMQVATSFKNQLAKLSETNINPEENKVVQERINKGIRYFTEHTIEHIKKPLDAITFSSDNQSVKKDFTKQIVNLEELLATKLTCLSGLSEAFSTSKYLELRAKAILEKTEPSAKKPKKKRAEVTSTEHPVLFEQLRALRKELSDAESGIPYHIFTQASLFEMCAYFPTTSKELKSINGMGKVRVEKYGTKIIAIIKKYVSENEVTPKEVVYDETIKKDTKPLKGNTKKHSLDLFKEGKTIDEIVEERGLTKNTIEGHLASFIETGEIRITDLISLDKFNELKKIIKNTHFEGLTDLKSKIDTKFTYSEIRMVNMNLNLNKKI